MFPRDPAKVEPMESLVGTFRISQPGSSVATSLCEGEAVPKHVGLLEIKGSDFRLQAIPLSQVSERSTTTVELSSRVLWVERGLWVDD